MKFVKNLLKLFIKRFKLYRARCFVFKSEGANLSLIKRKHLTKDEKGLLNEQWGGLGIKIHDDFYRMYKTVEQFNPLFVSDDLYYPLIIRTLNPLEYIVSFSHKGFYDIIFPNANKPKTFLTRIRGIYYDENRNVISQQQAQQIAQNSTPFIIKPTIDTSVGKNVYKISDCGGVDIADLFNSVGLDFIVQQVIEQSPQTAALNANSLNTIRVSTLYLNGRFSICTAAIKMGRNNAVVDNLGAGGLILGITDDGSLRDFAYDSKYNKYYQNGDFVFKGKRLEGMDKIKEFVEKLHISYLPHLAFVGWDIALDKNNEPILIEVNLKWPGVQFEQLSTASPAFGDRTNEVIDYVVKAQRKEK